MQCPHCQTRSRDGAQFCPRCGIKLATEGGAVRVASQTHTYFCDVCGASLALVSTAHQTSHYGIAAAIDVPPEAALESERKQVTVLFADLVSSTKLIAGRDPEEVRELLDPVIQVMMDSVH